MGTARISLLVAIATIVAACGSGVAGSDSPETNPDPTAPPTTTTTVVGDTATPDVTAPPEPPVTTTTTVPDTTIVDTDADAQAGDTEVFVYLLTENSGSHDYGCSYVTPATRLVDSPALLAGALDALLTGPTDAEIASGQGSWFQDDVGWELSSVTISNGVAYVDLTEDSQPIPNASTSCGSIALLAQLDYTATQFPTVDRAVYSFDGDVAAFYHWLQRDVPQL
ncbi:MAG: GerMN domain-containing protein [bacterium]|nr:GerMN domain-containing protein [bacterium]